MARTEKLKKSWPNLTSETYKRLKSSSRKVYSKGRLGMVCVHFASIAFNVEGKLFADTFIEMVPRAQDSKRMVRGWMFC